MKMIICCMAVSFMAVGLYAAEPAMKNCTCENCACTPEKNCGCFSEAGCHCSPEGGRCGSSIKEGSHCACSCGCKN